MKDLGIVLRVLAAVICGLFALEGVFITFLFVHHVLHSPWAGRPAMWVRGLIPLSVAVVPAVLCFVLLRNVRAKARETGT